MKQFYLSLIGIVAFFGHTMAQCTIPVLSNISNPDPVCSGETAILTAETDSGEIIWYDAETGGTELGTGSPFETGSLTETTSFWVEGNNGLVADPSISGGGKTAPTSSGGTSVNPGTGPWGLVFNATQHFLLNSVDVFLTSGTPGNIVIELKDSSFNVLETVTVAAPAGGTGSNPVQFTVPLDFTIMAGTGYRLVVVSNPPMIRDLGSNAFPFQIGTVGTITQGTINDANTNPGVYYFLYNWNFSPLVECWSEREEVIVTVNETDLPGGETEQTYTEGETIADLEVTGENLSWYSDPDGNNPIPDTTLLSNGLTYYVNQTVAGCTSELLAITVDNPLGLSQKVFADLNYYPNPVIDQLAISNGFAIDKIEIFDLQGKLLLSRDTSESEVNLDLTELSTGMYMLRIQSDDAVKTIKINKL